MHLAAPDRLAVLSTDSCTLHWLRLQHNPLGDAGVGALARALRGNQTLTNLQLRDTGMGERGCAELASAVAHHGALQSLSVEENYLPVAATEPLLRAMRASASLTSVTLDMERGGQYKKERSHTELMAEMTLTMLSRKSINGLGNGAANSKPRPRPASAALPS